MIRPAVRPLVFLLLASSALIPAAVQAQALPTGGSVARGGATIGAPADGAMTITQASDRAVINWQSFSIGEGNRVDIRQPEARSVLLNRVAGDATSTIAGSLNANGQVFLINPNGIQITATGTVRAAGFVASTLDIGDDDFMKGDIVVTGRGGRVANAGTIAVVRGGYAALIGGQVDNNGLIHAPLGRVALGAGTRATLDLAGDGFLQVALPTAAEGGVAMSGRISADGGSVILSAASAVDAARHIVNLTGVIEARGVGGTDGAVTLTGGDIRLAGAAIDVSGAGGGGGVRIGGDRQGRGALAHAQTVDIDAASTIRADATGSGGGGDITIWSDEATRFAGAISARGAGAGRGGEAEVSSAGRLDYRGTADLTGHAFGTLLLDPYDITISSGADSNASGFTATGADSVINVATLTNALALANVTVSTGPAGAQAGDITLAAPLRWTSSATLTLQAAGDISLNGAIDAAAGGLTLDAGGAIADSAALSVARFRLAAGDWSQVGATLPAFAAGDFSIATDGGATFLRAAGGTGVAADPYLLADIYGVQGVNGFLTNSFALGADIDATGTAYWNGGAGFVPLGTDGSGIYDGRLNGGNGFTGNFDGQGHVIADLAIDRPAAYLVGLFGYQGGGSISRIGMVGGSISGGSIVGGLVGYQIGDIRRSYTTGSVNGSVNGSGDIGGLVGFQESGSTVQSYATGRITGSGAGGLVGFQFGGSITQSYATGSVSGDLYIGGLVGLTDGDITQSYATGSVSGDKGVGGLVGYQRQGTSTITQSYATGSVNGSIDVGGLVGRQYNGSVTDSYWDSYTTGQSAGFGTQIGTAANVSGVTSDPAQSGAANYAFAKDAYAGFTFAAGPVTSAGADGWVWAGTGTRPFLAWDVPTAPAGGGPAVIRNAHQLQLINAGDLGGNYVLANDIDLTADLAAVGGKYPGMWSEAGFVPLGTDGDSNRLNANRGFAGNFDGQGHVIVGLAIDRPAASFVGLFGWQNSGSIRRVGLVGGRVNGRSSVGGLVGYQSGGSIAQSYATGSVSGGANYIGGLVGQNGGSITQSYATGSVSGNTNVGGLVGYRVDGSIAQSYATGSVSGIATVGGLVGLEGHHGGSITASYWDSYTTGQSAAIGNSAIAAGVAEVTSDPAQSGAANYAFAKDAYAGFTFAAGPVTSAGAAGWVWAGAGTRPFLAWEVPTAPAAGGPAVIRNAHQLQLINAGDLGGNYVLANGIDLTADLAAVGGKYPGMWSGAGFVPLGTDGDGNRFNGLNGFAGNFDGWGHEIAGLFINRRSTDFVGLFGYQGGGTIGRVGLVGGSVSGQDAVGELVGQQFSGRIVQSYATGSVSGNSSVGGLVGFQYNDGSIVQSYATGNVSAASGGVGGLVGVQYVGSIAQSYATGSVNGDIDVGGLVGLQGGGSIAHSYAAGSVSGDANVGGLVGSFGGSVTSSYWDTTATGQEHGWAGGDLAGASGLTTAQMQDLSNFAATYAGWDFTAVWSPPNQAGQNGGSAAAYYPELYALSSVVAVAPNDAVTVYGAPAQTPIAQYYGLHAGDSITAPATIAGASAASDAGSYALTASGARASDPAYRFVYQPATLSVTPAPLTVTANDLTRVYDGTAFTGNGVTYSGFVNGEGESVLGGSLLYGGNALGAVDAGAYTIAVSGLSSSNYAISYGDGALTITPRALTVTADAMQRIYGDANPAPTYAITAGTLVSGDGLTGTLATSATTASNVGAYAITQGSLAASPNYALTYQAADLTITPADLTVTYAATPVSSLYGDTPLLTGMASAVGLKNGETLTAVTSGTVAWTSPGDATSDVGRYAVTGSGLVPDSSNYRFAFVQDAANATALTITPRALTVTADAQSRIYGDANPALTYRVGGLGLVNGDTLTGGLATSAAAASGIGAYAIGQGSLAASSNYSLTYRGGNLVITPRALTVAADALSRIYGDANSALTYAITEGRLVNGDILSGDLTTAATAASDIGAYAITQGSLAASSNYALTYRGADLTVTPRALTVTADALSRVYGDADPALTYRIGGLGLVNGDTLTGGLATSAAAASGIGAYAITQGSLAASPNYALTYRGADLTITPRALTITADALSRIYGDANPALTYRVGGLGLVNGDTLTGGLATSAAAASGIGAYAIGQGSLAASPNYALTYRGADLTITPRALTVTADALSRIYGAVNPALTYRVGGLGLVNGDVLTGGLTTDATSASDVGSYAITRGSLAVSSNYTLTYRGADLSITPRALTVTADALSRIYGDANPALTYTVGGLGLVNGDTLSGALATGAIAASNVGSYAIVLGSLAASPNYALTYRGADLTIAPRALTVTADALSRLYGDINPALTYRIGGLGLVNGDTLTGALATRAIQSSIPGRYGITQGTLGASANYVLRFAPGVLTIQGIDPVSPAVMAGSSVRDAFATTVDPLAGLDSVSPIAGLFPASGDGASGDAGVGMEGAAAIDCLRKRPCPAPRSAAQ
ncbi:MBG domain-containing protein [Sphingopyxis sp.]|uniref:MBG domain-containing protein n=1 Tax=Sphingopyxis sp. TaxID=1908224 RepID=UPI002619B3BF|nr:MBG domain-containing protein [Sphingopyxis sp.]MCW0198964.1 filamentous hemagglutinin N-terminal domain-containing protein [Sphingopyxis sp.]